MVSPFRRAEVPFTYAYYCTLPDDGKRYELIEGDLFVTPAPVPFHQTVSGRLMHALMSQLEDTGIAIVFHAPCDILLADTTVVQPDLAIVRRARKSIVTHRAIEGPPDVVVEILSPSTRDRDRYVKSAAYARFDVAEYWLVDPEHGWVEVFVPEGGSYRLQARHDRASTLTSPSFPEIRIPLEPVFRPH